MNRRIKFREEPLPESSSLVLIESHKNLSADDWTDVVLSVSQVRVEVSLAVVSTGGLFKNCCRVGRRGWQYVDVAPGECGFCGRRCRDGRQALATRCTVHHTLSMLAPLCILAVRGGSTAVRNRGSKSPGNG